VLCAAGSTNRIVVDRGDRLDPDCRGPASSVSYRRPAGGPTIDAPAARVAQQPPITGDGTTGNPFVAPCSDPWSVDCTVNAFPRRYLKGLWANEYVPAYRCPTDHPYLKNGRYVPDGVLVPQGGEIDQGGAPDGSPWPIGILLSNASTTNARLGVLADNQEP
jgi:hypothetical protein